MRRETPPSPPLRLPFVVLLVLLVLPGLAPAADRRAGAAQPHTSAAQPHTSAAPRTDAELRNDAELRTDIGEIQAARYRIDLPPQWNGDVVVYLHGYAFSPPTFKAGPPASLERVFLDKGFAFVQSAYSTGGWSIEEGIADSEALLKYFTHKYGKPRATFLLGQSMGGFQVMLMAERSPQAYRGALALCAPVGSAITFLGRRAFDLRAVFDVYFPNVFPSPDRASPPPADSVARVKEALASAPDRAASVRRFAGLTSDDELAQTLVLYVHVLANVEQRAHGNPFDNRNIVYQGSADDAALNDAVARYAADPAAEAWLRQHQSATGHLVRPMVVLQNTYDPVVPAWVGNQYAELVAGRSDPQLFHQMYVKGSGHCAISPDEAWSAFATLPIVEARQRSAETKE